MSACVHVCMCRFLMVRTDEEVKLLLEALQMSVSSCMQMPDVAMLRSQMLARLMTVPRLQVGFPQSLFGWVGVVHHQVCGTTVTCLKEKKVRCAPLLTGQLCALHGLQSCLQNGVVVGWPPAL